MFTQFHSKVRATYDIMRDLFLFFDPSTCVSASLFSALLPEADGLPVIALLSPIVYVGERCTSLVMTDEEFLFSYIALKWLRC